MGGHLEIEPGVRKPRLGWGAAAGVAGAGGDPGTRQARQDGLCKSSATSSALGNGPGSCEILWGERSAPAKRSRVGVLLGLAFPAVCVVLGAGMSGGSRLGWNKEFSCVPQLKWPRGVNSWFEKEKAL